MYNAYEHESNGIASGKKYDYCEYRRGHESGEPKVKTDFLLPVLKVQIILCIAIGIFMIIMFKTQSSVFLFLRESYYNISSTDIPFAEVVKSIKKSADFVFEPINDTDKVKKNDETESYSQEAFSLASYDDNELTGIGGEDILTAKEKTSFAPVSMSQKAVMPVENAKITSKFGYRVNPVTEEYGFHTGLDLAVREGTPIRATFGGTVTKAQESKLRGNYIVISHSDNVETVYCHCKELFVSEGDIVSAGDIIALAGMTGQATGPHLHFELKINGLWCNPVWILDI